MVRGCGPRSLHPSPARSYEHTRAKPATPGGTRAPSTEKSPTPASRMTVGAAARASPVQSRCSRHPPTSTRRPGGAGGPSGAPWAFARPGLDSRSVAAMPATAERRITTGFIGSSLRQPPVARTLDDDPVGSAIGRHIGLRRKAWSYRGILVPHHLAARAQVPPPDEADGVPGDRSSELQQGTMLGVDIYALQGRVTWRCDERVDGQRAAQELPFQPLAHRAPAGGEVDRW